ncbi:MAG: tetratricopeptide repeat protein, partial [Gemmatimonadota bacterium]|nr:tetratricopeptide repeat protein [Gemmatimonadota bacterium]
DLEELEGGAPAFVEGVVLIERRASGLGGGGNREHAQEGEQEETAYFGAGMTLELTTALNKIPGLRVKSPGSTARFRDRASLTSAAIADRLGARLLLDGAVQLLAEAVRVSWQLVDAPSDEQLAGDSYEATFTPDGIFDLQARIAARIAEALGLGVREPGLEPGLGTDDLGAYQAYLEGLYRFEQAGAGGFQAAIPSYERAIELDPDFALAHAGLAEAWLASAHSGVLPELAFTEGIRHAEHAIALDPGLADAYTVQADSRFHYEWDWEGAERAFLLGLELQPTFATAHWWYAGLLAALGRFDEAEEQLDMARAKDPITTPVMAAFAGRVYYWAGRYDEAADAARRAIELSPTSAYAQATLGYIELRRGRVEEALAHFEEAAVLAPPAFLMSLANGLAAAGRREEALDALARLEAIAETLPPDRFVSPYQTAKAYAALGDVERALDLLEAAAEIRDASLVWVNVEPLFEPLRGGRRFRELLGRMGLRAASS